MQVGLTNAFDQVALAETTAPDGTYRYQLFTDGLVGIDKRAPDGGWQRTYHYALGACNCPGYAYRSDCKHALIASGLVQWWREHG